MALYQSKHALRKPRLRKLALIGVLALSLTAGAAAAGMWAYSRGLNGNLDRVDALPGAAAAPATGAMDLLIVGTDSREPDDEQARTDTIMLAHVTENRDHVYLSSIARDTWVPIPGHGTSKINAAGEHHFTGAEALDYVRQRKQFPDGDFSRQKHQQQLITAVMDKAASAGILIDPLRLNAFLQPVTVDNGFDLGTTAFALRGLRSSAMTFLTSPNKGVETIDGESVVLPDPQGAAELYSSFSSDTVERYLSANPEQ